MMEPTPEQFAEWLQQALNAYHLSCRPGTHGEFKVGNVAGEVARLAYAAGADAELEGCCNYVENAMWGAPSWAADLYGARRPNPPSLKQQALGRLFCPDGSPVSMLRIEDWRIIVKAVESLPDDS